MGLIKPIAMYLPQFHPIPENDEWWGKGFTEWRNVTKAKPLFKGHLQPHLPADLGFYDLRLSESRQEQAAMAKAYGIHGFCYYHYWFNGRRILHRPFQEVFESGQPDFPFMLCWANENWTRRWDGADHEILLEQKYNQDDDLKHIKVLLQYFKDPRYIKLNGKPVFIIYRPHLLPNIQKTITTWRQEAAKEGMELYLCKMEFNHLTVSNPKGLGFDAGIAFEPFFSALPKIDEESFFEKIIRKLFTKKNSIYWQHQIFDYEQLVEAFKKRALPTYEIIPGVSPCFDNSPRVPKSATLFKNCSPELYREWLMNVASRIIDLNSESKFIFINAWNEWAEGNHLEPCQHWGLQYLEATKYVVEHV